MAGLAFSGIAGLAALVVFALMVAWVRRYPPIGLGLLCLILIPLWEVPYPPPIATLSALSIYPSDLVTLVLFVAGLLEMTQLRANLRGWLLPWVFFGVCIAVSLLGGVAAFGPGTAVNAARALLYFFMAMTWALAVRPDRLRLHTFSLVLGWALTLIGLYHGVGYGFGDASSSLASAGDVGFRSGRILIASQAMALLLCAATVFPGPSVSGKVRQQFCAVSSFVFGGIVVLAQHRSVWGAGALGMFAVFLLGRRWARKQVFVLLVLGAWALLVGWSSGILDGSGIVQSASNATTYDWRTLGWQVLISQAIARGPLTVVAGEPFGGSYYLRQLSNGGWTSVSAHNWYVDIFLSLGIIGLIAIVSMLLSALVKSRAIPAVWTFLLAAVIAYGWAYSAEWYLAPWLGAAMTMSLRGGRSAAVDEDVGVPMEVGIQVPGSRRLMTTPTRRVP